MQLSKLGRVGIIAAVAVAVVGLGIYAYKRTTAKNVVETTPVDAPETAQEPVVEKAEGEYAVNVEFICTGTCAIKSMDGEILTSLRIVGDSAVECLQMVGEMLQGTTLVVHGDADEIESAASTLRSTAIAVSERIVSPGEYRRQILLTCDALTVMVSNPHVIKE